MGELLVHGRAEGRLLPTSAVLDVAVHVRDAASQQAAVDRTAQVCETVDRAVAEARRGDDPLVRVAETSSIRATEVTEHASGGQRRRVGWLAERGTRLECAPDAEGLTELVGALVHDDVRVSGPQWHLAPDVGQWDALRSAAVADAVRRATAYARGVDAAVGAVRWIAEPGLRARPDRARSLVDGTARRMSASFDEDDHGSERRPVSIAVEPVAVEVAVEVALDLA